MGQWVASNHNNADEYVGSSLPFATGSLATPNAALSVKKVTFPYVTRWIVVANESSTTPMRVGFTENGASGSNPAYTNFFRIAPSSSTPRLEVKCTEIFVAHEGATSTCSIVAGYTNIPKKNFPVLTGSDGFEGVG